VSVAIPKTNPGATAPAGNPAPLPGAPTTSPAWGNDSGAGVEAVAKHGGLPNGKAGVDGTVPGTDEHAAARRKAERERKAKWRAKKAAENPPALPTVLPGSDAPTPGQASPPPLVQAPGVVSDFVPWDVEPLREIAGEVVSLVEQAQVARQTTKAFKAGLPKAMIAEVEKNSRVNPAIKVTIAKTGPPEICKAFESAGISGKWQNLTLLFAAAGAWFAASRKASADTDRMIAEFKGPQPPEEKKP
jgi:hypothetical protein